MPRGDPAEGLILCTTRALVADEVRIGTAEPVGRTASWALTMIL